MTNVATTIDLGLIVNNEQVMVSSRTVAEKFGRRHDNILQRIKNLDCSEEFTALNFQVSEYRDSTGRSNSEFLMTRDGFTFCVMGMTGKKAAEFKEKYIQAFNEMEQRLKSNGLKMPESVQDVVGLLAQYATAQQAEVKALEGRVERASSALKLVNNYIDNDRPLNAEEITDIERHMVATLNQHKLLALDYRFLGTRFVNLPLNALKKDLIVAFAPADYPNARGVPGRMWSTLLSVKDIDAVKCWITEHRFNEATLKRLKVNVLAAGFQWNFVGY